MYRSLSGPNNALSQIAKVRPCHDCLGLILMSGYLRTQGNQIVDEAGNPVKLTGINWFGMESTRFAPDGLQSRNYKDMMQQMVDLGYLPR